MIIAADGKYSDFYEEAKVGSLTWMENSESVEQEQVESAAGVDIMDD